MRFMDSLPIAKRPRGAWIARRVAGLLSLAAAVLGWGAAHATCVQTGPGPGGGDWSYAQNRPIGPANLVVYPQRFMPVGTVLFDQTYPMAYILGGNPDAVLALCTDTTSAAKVSAALRLDDTYSFGGFTDGGVRYYYVQYVLPTNLTMHTTVGYKLYGVMADGSERELVFNDNNAPSNTAVVFPTSGGYEASTRVDKVSYPYVVMAKHFPAVRLVMVRSPYDDNKFEVVSDGFIGRIGISNLVSGGGSTDSSFGYINIGNYQPTPSAACGVTRVPRTVELGSHPVSSLNGGGAPWTAFDVTYECTSSMSPASSLRIGLEPQNRARLVATDPRYLQPDAAAGAAGGVGIVHRRQGESGGRYWVQNSGCAGVSSATQNNSNCPLARSQTQGEGWYRASPVTSSAAAEGYIEYGEPFEARIERLPLTAPGDVTVGTVSATVNVLVNQP